MTTCLYCNSSYEGFTKFCCQSCELLYNWVNEGQRPVNFKSKTSEKWLKFNNQIVENQYNTSEVSHFKKFKFHIEGLQCSSCVHLLEEFPKFDTNIISSRLNYSRALLETEVKLDFQLGDLCKAIEELGYLPTPLKELADYELALKKENRVDLKRIGVAGAVAANEMLFSIPIYAGLQGNLNTAFKYIGLVLFLPLLGYSALPFYKKAWASLLARRVSVDAMIVVALWAGFISSCTSLFLGREDIYFDSTASFIFLILLTRYFLKHHQNKFIKKDIFSDMFSGEIFEVIQKNKSVFKAFNQLQRLDTVLVKKNQFIPVDGVLKSESCLLDLSFLTGESYPQKRHAGENILAGSLQLDNEAEIICTLMADETNLSKSLRQLDLMATDKNKFQTLTDVISHRLTLIVFLFAIIYFLVTFEALGYESFKRCLALITIACPCAVAFGTPLAHHLGMRYAFKKGFMVKSELVFEKLNLIKRVIFDKTGTLTSSDLKLINSYPPQLNSNLKEIILGLEKISMHPIAVSLKKIWADINPKQIQNLNEKSGVGVEGEFEGHHYQLQKSRNEMNSSLMQVDFIKDGQNLAYLFFEENLHPEARAVIDYLYQREFEVMMLSGDKRSRVLEVAKKLAIRPSFVFSEQTAESKLKVIQEQNPCLFIGDGLNDLQALKSAHVSFAIRGPFEATIQVSDIYAPLKNLNSISEIIEIAKRVQNTVQINLLFAILYNAIGGTLALMGFINPLFAAILMPISSLLITSHTTWRLK